MKLRLIILCVFILMLTSCGKNGGASMQYEDFGAYTVKEIASLQLREGNSCSCVSEGGIYYTETDNQISAVDGDGKKRIVYTAPEGYVSRLFSIPDSQDIAFIHERNSAEEKKYALMRISSGGELVSEIKLQTPDPFSFYQAAVDKEGILYVFCDQVLYSFGQDGVLEKQLETDTDRYSLFRNEAGRVMLAKVAQETCTIYEMEEDLVEQCSIRYYGAGNCLSFFDGEETGVFFVDESFLYHYSATEKGITPIVNWNEVGVAAADILEIGPGSVPGTFLFLLGKRGMGQAEVKQIVGQDEGVAVKTKLVLACNGAETALIKRVCEFNMSNENYAVYVKNYETEEDPYTSLSLDIFTGQGFDIVDLSTLPANLYADKGILMDLSPYINEEDYVDAYIRAISIEDKIYQVSPTFTIYTILGDGREACVEPGWTQQTFLEYLQKNSSHPTLAYADTAELMRQLLKTNCTDLIGTINGENHSDGDKLAVALQYIKKAEASKTLELYRQGQSVIEIAREYPTLLVETMLSSVSQLRLYEYAFQQHLVAKGYPSENGSGNFMGLGLALGIGANSKHQDAAWEFIQAFLQDEMQLEMAGNGFPTGKNALKKALNTFGKEEMPLSINGQEERLPALSEEQVKFFYQTVDTIDTLYPDNAEIFAIIQEEAEPYLLGQKSLEQATEGIENRVSLYLEEQR